MLRFTCEQCGKSLKADESAVDRKARCPKCGHRMPVMPEPSKVRGPQPPSDATDLQYQPGTPTPGEPEAEFVIEDNEPEPEKPVQILHTREVIWKRAPAPNAFSSGFQWMLGGILAIAFCIIVGTIISNSKPSRRHALEQEADEWGRKGVVQRWELENFKDFTRRYRQEFGKEWDAPR